VFLCSVSAERGGGVSGGVAYYAAKAAQLGFARALARELGPAGSRSTRLPPGLIDTDITGDAIQGERKAQLIAATPVGGVGTVDDVADVIACLCRAESDYIIGATYDVNGGSQAAGRVPVRVVGPRDRATASRVNHRSRGAVLELPKPWAVLHGLRNSA